MLLAACGSSAPGAPPANEGLVLDQPTPQTVALVNQQGHAVTLAGLHGKVVVLAPVPVAVPGRVPARHRRLHHLQRDLRAAGLAHRVVFVEATVDPGRDTVARLAAYQKEFGADWDLWTGTPANIAAFWKPFGVDYQIVPEERPRQDGLVDGPAADLRRGPHGRLHPHQPVRARALRQRLGAQREGPARLQAARAPRRRRPARPAEPPGPQLDDGRRARRHRLAARHDHPCPSS